MPKRKKGRCLKWSKGRTRCLRRASSRRAVRLAGLGKLSRKHYQDFARVLCEVNAPQKTINAISAYFATDNPGFKPALFKKAAKKCRV